MFDLLYFKFNKFIILGYSSYIYGSFLDYNIPVD